MRCHVSIVATHRFYEAHIEDMEENDYVRIGWALQGFACEGKLDGAGVGDDMLSWGYDGRSLRFVGREIEIPYSRPLRAGD